MIKILLTITLLVNFIFANELENAYQKEYAYLIAEKNALSKRIDSLKQSQDTNIKKVKIQIKSLQKKSLSYQNKIDKLNQEIVIASRGADVTQTDDLLLDATILQAKESVKKANIELIENEKKELTIKDALLKANQIMQNDEKVTTTKGKFFLDDGKEVEGTIVNIGRVAKYGTTANTGGLLSPAGDGDFKIWDNLDYEKAKNIQNNPSNIDIFLYESSTKAIEKKEAKKFEDDLDAGGPTGYVILILGAFGLLLALLRTIFLSLSGASANKLKEQITPKLKANDIEGALDICKKSNGSASKVMAATIRNLDKDREHIEDIISESILHESSHLDRFGSFILVIAAISPLLGLLGTVTGMISTFDIITEFGTGDPKMLSSGISEALITTKFGLVVAIPLLVLGNVLSSWAEKIKDNMEQSALHIINKNKS
ncbi:MAG: MotA/TolQ/ExbB proton channel family protein [Campylobacterota bacterium]|nr:MotA/TolQ/ExbB proton channel family protein [Campylobacterota bacterium]